MKPNNKGKIIFLVAPGLGKTTLNENNPSYLDFDVGSVRKHFMGKLVAKDHHERWEKAQLWFPSLFEALSISLRFYDRVLINEPAFARYIKQRKPDIRVITVIPQSNEDWISRVCKRERDEFCSLITANAVKEDWLGSWINTGKQLGDMVVLEPKQFLSDIVETV